MYNDIAALQSFYHSRLGRNVQDRIAAALARYLPSRPDERVMGFGFALPYLDAFANHCACCFAMMPARQGAQIWPNISAVASCLVMEESLPLPDASLDRIIMIHALEYVENAPESLRELWRVLTPCGQIILIVANRNGIWSATDHTPFGNGEPYSRRQLAQLLRENGFILHSLTEKLHLWPGKNGKAGRFSFIYEKLSRRLVPYFGGVLVAHAQKQTAPIIPARARQSRRYFVPTLVPQASYPSQSSKINR